MRQVKEMGPLQNVLGMLPGRAQGAASNAEIDDREIDRVEAIICSMTPAERRDPSLINGSRRVRIANGSGVDHADVNGLLKQFKMVQQMMKSAGKGKMPKFPMGELARAELAAAVRSPARRRVGYAFPSHFARRDRRARIPETRRNPFRGREDPPDAGREEEATDVPRRGGRRSFAPRRAVHRDHRAVRPPPGAVVLLEIDAESALAWLRKGAQPTEQVQKLLTATGRVGAVRGGAQQARGHASCRGAGTPPAR